MPGSSTLKSNFERDGRLELFNLRQVLMLKTQRAIRKLSKPTPEIGVEWAGIDRQPSLDLAPFLKEVRTQFHGDVLMVQQASEHGSISIFGHGLIFVGEVAIILSGADRDASGDSGTQLRQIQSPLLTGVVA